MNENVWEELWSKEFQRDFEQPSEEEAADLLSCAGDPVSQFATASYSNLTSLKELAELLRPEFDSLDADTLGIQFRSFSLARCGGLDDLRRFADDETNHPDIRRSAQGEVRAMEDLVSGTHEWITRAEIGWDYPNLSDELKAKPARFSVTRRGGPPSNIVETRIDLDLLEESMSNSESGGPTILSECIVRVFDEQGRPLRERLTSEERPLGIASVVLARLPDHEPILVVHADVSFREVRKAALGVVVPKNSLTDRPSWLWVMESESMRKIHIPLRRSGDVWLAHCPLEIQGALDGLSDSNCYLLSTARV